MKVIQVNVVYPYGSTGKIVYDIHNELVLNKIDSLVLCGRSESKCEEILYSVGKTYSRIQSLLGRIHGLSYGGCFFSTKRIINLIKKNKPDVVHLHCLNGNFVNIYKLISWLKKEKINTILTLHAEFMYTANCSYAFDCEGYINGCLKCKNYKNATRSIIFNKTSKSWNLMKRAFEGFDNLKVVSVSPWLMERASKSSILKNFEHYSIFNGLNTDIFHFSSDNLNKEDYKIIFHATPEFNCNPEHLKGGYYILKLAEKMINMNVKFYIAGNYDKNICVPNNVILLGKISNQKELSKYYQSADLTVIASKIETFSMVCAESLSCGTPVVGFKAGAPELISLKEYSAFSEYGDVELLYENVLKMISIKQDKEKISQEAHKLYSKSINTQKYIDLYKKIVIATDN